MKEFSKQEQEILKNAKESLLTYATEIETEEESGEGIAKVASFYINNNNSGAYTGTPPFNFRQAPYAAPLTTLSDQKIPTSMTEVFRWCKYVFMFDSLISGTINALANFPITEITLEDKISRETVAIHDNGVKSSRYSGLGIIETDSSGFQKELNEIIKKVDPDLMMKQEKGTKDVETSGAMKTYRKVLFDNIDIYKNLIEIGIDYFLYGNCFVMGTMGTNEEGEPEWKRMVRLNPEKVTIDYNEITGQKVYKWTPTEQIVKIVRSQSPKDQYDKIPDIVKEAVNQRKALVIHPDYIYHFSRASDSGSDNSAWGIPLALNVIKLVMYRNILRQAQEAIAREHIVPFRIFYITASSDGMANPIGNYPAVANNLAKEIAKSVADPNYKVVSPYPVNLIETGGNGRSLLLTPEIEQIQNEILAGMNTPREFIFGGLSYSSSSIALKILENNFITYRLLLKDYLQNFVIKGMAIARNEWINEDDDDELITVSFTDLKMQDDVQQKQMIINLNMSGKVTNEFMWQSLGLDVDKMQDGLEEESLRAVELEHEIAMKRLQSQQIQQIQQMKNQMMLRLFEFELTEKMKSKNPEFYNQLKSEQQTNIQENVQNDITGPGREGNGVGRRSGGPMDQEEEMNATITTTPPQNQENSLSEHPTHPEHPANPEQSAKGSSTDEIRQMLDGLGQPELSDLSTDIIKKAQSIAGLNPSQKLEEYKKMELSTAQKVAKVVQIIEAQQDQGETDMRPMPEQRPPRRNSLK